MRTIHWLTLATVPFVLQPAQIPLSSAQSQRITEPRVIAALRAINAEPRVRIDATSDVHQVLLAPPEDALAELARRFCQDEQPRSMHEVHPLSQVYEPHAGQTLLALSALVIDARVNDVPLCNVPLGSLILRETSTPRYEVAEAFILDSLATLLEAETAKVPSRASSDFAEWLLSAPRRRLRQRLTELDLSWYGQLQALTISLATAPSDGRSIASSLRRTVDAQLRYIDADRRYPSFNYVTEHGVHTLAMLLVTIGALGSHPSVDANHVANTYQAHAHSLFAALMRDAPPEGAANASRSDATRAQLRAHLLHLALCEPRPLLSLEPERSSAQLETVADQVLVDVERGIDVPSAGWHFHAKEALVHLLRYIRHGRPGSDFSDCASV